MGLVGTIVEVKRTLVDGVPITDIKIDEGGGDITTAELYQSSGSDHNPLPGDFVAAMKVPGQDRFVIVGYLDPINEPTTEAGEVRAYSRDADGNILCTIKLTDFVNLGIDDPENFIPRDDRLQTQLSEIEANIADLQSAHDNHVHTNPEGGNVGPALPTTTETYSVGDTATDKVKGE